MKLKNVSGRDQSFAFVRGISGTTKGSFTARSGEFEVSDECRPIPAKVCQTREQIVARAREAMVCYWKRLKDAGNVECKALEPSFL